MNDKRRLSRSVEDYLKAIYALAEGKQAASTNDVAQALEVQPASVSGMIKRMAEMGLVEHSPYRGVQLTEAGELEAIRIIRRHRVLETYLHLKLNYSWDDVHGEAERLEHAASDALIDHMASALGDPRHDPHGAPIPTRGGRIEATSYTTLSEVEVGTRVAIRAVRDDDPERLRYLESRGLVPGACLDVEGREPFAGPITVRLGGPDGEAQVVGYEIARRIYVAAQG